VVRQSPGTDKVFFGAWVTLEKADGHRVEYCIVGADEADAVNGTISIDSPLARALLKKTVDDEITVTTEQRSEQFIICQVRYE
jgi:transcription elongation factor GreB